jgi:hypothetical protein
MAHAARDPVFNAMLAITNSRSLPLGMDVAEYCLRCHAPNAWLAGRSHELSTEHFTSTDLEGVQCDFCHRATDPLAPDAGAATGGTVPGYGNGMFVVMPRGERRRGPRPGGADPPHEVVYDPFLSTSEFCGTCHDVSNPYFDPSPSTTPPAHQPALERTYSEWALSWYASLGAAGTCQSCHMGDGEAAHAFAGANTFLARIIPRFQPDADSTLLRTAVNRTLGLLARAARLEADAGRTPGGVSLLVRITNLTGHKLPTGFAEGRRLWLEVRGYDDGGNEIWSSGAYNHATATLQQDPQLTLYEARLGASAAAGSAAGIPPGPTYHAAFTDSVCFDNRIPPRGFLREAFRSRRAEPVGASYVDGQYWDLRRYDLPSEVSSVGVRLLLQQVTPSFAAFLRDENAGNPYDWGGWGERVYAAWREHGQPVELRSVRVGVGTDAPVLGPFQDPLIPLDMHLEQNYPNPFNGGTRIAYSVNVPVSGARLAVFDLAGREVARLLEGTLPAGGGEVIFDSGRIASGVYLFRFQVGASSVTRKLVVIR